MSAAASAYIVTVTMSHHLPIDLPAEVAEQTGETTVTSREITDRLRAVTGYLDAWFGPAGSTGVMAQFEVPAVCEESAIEQVLSAIGGLWTGAVPHATAHLVPSHRTDHAA